MVQAETVRAGGETSARGTPSLRRTIPSAWHSWAGGAATRELHLPVLAGHEGVRVTALVDRDAGRARELARAYKVETVLTETAALDRSVADAAVICTPPSHHAPGSIELAGRGLHVLVEKPMAVEVSNRPRRWSVRRSGPGSSWPSACSAGSCPPPGWCGACSTAAGSVKCSRSTSRRGRFTAGRRRPWAT